MATSANCQEDSVCAVRLIAMRETSRKNTNLPERGYFREVSFMYRALLILTSKNAIVKRVPVTEIYRSRRREDETVTALFFKLIVVMVSRGEILTIVDGDS